MCKPKSFSLFVVVVAAILFDIRKGNYNIKGNLKEEVICL